MKGIRAGDRRSGGEGFALFFIIGLCLGIVAVVLLFANAMRLENRGAGNTVAGRQAQQVIEGARRYVAFVLENAEAPGYMPSLDTYSSEEAEVGEGRFWLVGKDPGDSAPATVCCSLVDEASKLNLNTATQEMLEVLPNMTSELAAAIVDWRDEDTELTEGGMESANYLLLDPPYLCKDSGFETVEELRLVLGVDLDLLYGEDWNLNHVLDPNEDDGDALPPDDNMDGKLDCGLLEYVTVYSVEPNTDSDGNARANVNSADSSQLQQSMAQGQGTAGGGSLQASRSGTSYSSVLEYFVASGMSAEDFAEIEDSLTVSDEEAIAGRVNVNTACEEVLACIPGIGTELASQLVAARQGKTEEELQSITWVAEVLDETAAKEAGPNLTTHSYQFTADIVAVGRLGRGFRRTAFVFDTSGDEVTVVARRDMRRFGWPLGGETLAALRGGEDDAS